VTNYLVILFCLLAGCLNILPIPFGYILCKEFVEVILILILISSFPFATPRRSPWGNPEANRLWINHLVRECTAGHCCLLECSTVIPRSLGTCETKDHSWPRTSEAPLAHRWHPGFFMADPLPRDDASVAVGSLRYPSKDLPHLSTQGCGRLFAAATVTFSFLRTLPNHYKL